MTDPRDTAAPADDRPDRTDTVQTPTTRTAPTDTAPTDTATMDPATIDPATAGTAPTGTATGASTRPAPPAVDPDPADPGAYLPTGFEEEPAPPARRRGPDPVALLVGLATLAMAVFALVGELPDLPDPRWLLAGGAVAVGLVLLVGSLRGRSRGPRT